MFSSPLSKCGSQKWCATIFTTNFPTQISPTTSPGHLCRCKLQQSASVQCPSVQRPMRMTTRRSECKSSKKIEDECAAPEEEDEDEKPPPLKRQASADA